MALTLFCGRCYPSWSMQCVRGPAPSPLGRKPHDRPGPRGSLHLVLLNHLIRMERSGRPIGIPDRPCRSTRFWVQPRQPPIWQSFKGQRGAEAVGSSKADRR
mmetsp:Transcript_75072/g.132680  ORF Transcript_75072/g.132680 Transcript_75072/m.132680 type:complete len:102 (-) Transcript_75072:109-414(-)